ncbi:uncharacterized protein LOC144867758 isoform X1 [Branchiostoma floridae x Branchiostoma japonicum]
MAKPRLHDCTDRQWWFEVEDGEVNANIAGIDYRIVVVQVDKSTKDDTVAIQNNAHSRQGTGDSTLHGEGTCACGGACNCHTSTSNKRRTVIFQWVASKMPFV